MKRTTVTIPQELLEDLMKVTKAKNKTQAVLIAIEDEVKRRKLERIKEMAGSMDFDMDADELRHKDKRLG